MAIAKGLISSLLTIASFQDVFLLTVTTMFASWFSQSLPLLSFVLHSFFHYRVGNDL